jgi:cellulose biosynthesis protein BcsQ
LPKNDNDEPSVKTLALYNLKGGVGKTSAAVNLAYLAADYGYRTLLWDLDPQGASTYHFRVLPKLRGGAKKLIKGKHPIGEYMQHTEFERLDLIPSDFSNRQLDTLLDPERYGTGRLSELLEPFSETHSLAVLDCPPSISHLSENVFRAADIIALPLIPSPLVMRAYEQVVTFLAKAKIKGVKMHPFLSMVDRRRRLHNEQLETLPASLKTLLRTYIPYASIVEQMGVRRAPLPSFDHSSEASRSYESLWRELEALLRRS